MDVESLGLGVFVCAGLVLLVLPAVPAGAVLFAIVALRALTDFGMTSTGTGPAAFVAASAGLGVLAMIAAVVPSGTPLRPAVHAVVGAILFVLALGSWVAIDIAGFSTTTVSEAAAYVSMLALFVLAARFGRGRGNDPLRHLALAVLPAGVLSFAGFVSGQEFALSPGGRLAGTFSHPSPAGAFFAVAALTLIVVAWQLRSPWALVSAAVSLVGLVMTQTLGAVLAFAVGGLVFLLFSAVLRTIQKAAVLIVTALLGTFAFLSSSAAGRLAEFEEMDVAAALATGSSANSLEWRIINWERLLHLWSERPVLGYGLGSTSTYVMPLGGPPHSLPIELLVEFGLVGAAVILAAAVPILMFIARWTARGRWEGALMLALVAFMLVNGAESNLPDYTAAMYLLAVVFGLLYARLRTTPEADPPGGSAAAVPAVPDLPAVPRWDGRRRTATGAHSGRVSP